MYCKQTPNISLKKSKFFSFWKWASHDTRKTVEILIARVIRCQPPNISQVQMAFVE